MKNNLRLLITALMLVTPPLAFAAQVDKQSPIYSVTHIAPEDTLNVRSGPGTSYPVIAVLPANGKGVIATGKENQINQSTWAHVTWAGVDGWVNKYYLVEDTGSYQPAEPSASSSARQVVMSCVGVEPRWNIHISSTSAHINGLDNEPYTIPVTFRQQSANHSNIAVVAGKKDQRLTQLFLQKVEACTVGGRSYPYSIAAVLDERQVVSGCCRVINP